MELKVYTERGQEIVNDSIEWFKDHVVNIQEFDGITVVRFANPNTVNFSMNVIYHKNFIHISGDVGEATYDTTWVTSPFKRIPNFQHFTGKLACVRGGKKEWDYDECVADLAEWVKDTKEEHEDDETKLSELDEFVEGLESHMESEWDWIGNLQNSDLDEWDETCESSLWQAGERLNDRLYTYWVALNMIAKALESR